MDEEMVAKDLPKLLSLTQDMNSKISDVIQLVTSLKKKVSSPEFNTDQGISFLELKYHLLLSYVLNLTQTMMLKVEGKPIVDAPSIDRLVELRTVLEKMRPIEHKLRYQIDKLIRIATSGPAVSTNDPLRFKPNPSNLVSKLADEKSQLNDSDHGADDDDSETSATEDEVPKLYVPPRVMAVPYQEDTKRDRQHLRSRAVHSSLIQELRDEFSDAPAEIKTSESGLRKQREVLKEKELERYEEEHMLRLQRKKRGRDSGRSTRETLDHVTDFSALEALTQEVGDVESGPLRKKPKRKGRKFKKGSYRRKHKH